MESNLDGQMDSHSYYNTIIVHTCGSCNIPIPRLLNIVVIDNFDLHIFQLT